MLDAIGGRTVNSHVSKCSEVSLHTHFAYLFKKYLDYAIYKHGNDPQCMNTSICIKLNVEIAA